MWPVWGLIEDGHHGGWPVAAYRPIAAHYTEIPICRGRQGAPPQPPEDANSAGSSRVHPPEPQPPRLPWGQALISRDLCLPVCRTWMWMLRRLCGGRWPTQDSWASVHTHTARAPEPGWSLVCCLRAVTWTSPRAALRTARPFHPHSHAPDCSLRVQSLDWWWSLECGSHGAKAGLTWSL